MLEKDLAREFGEVFSSWPCYHVVSKSDPGWPDRMLVLPMSRVCYVELKIVSITLDDTFIIELRPDQAAWLAKWQRIGGLCFVMCMSGNDLMKGKNYGLRCPKHATTSAPQYVYLILDRNYLSGFKYSLPTNRPRSMYC
jgi:hypothetical protein